MKRAVRTCLALSLGELPPILTNEVDRTLMMALSRTFVRLRNEIAALVSRPMGDREADILYSLSTVDSIRRILAEEYGAAVAETNPVLSGRSICILALPPAPARGRTSPAAQQRPPAPSPPHYGVGSGSFAPPPHGTASGSATPSQYC